MQMTSDVDPKDLVERVVEDVGVKVGDAAVEVEDPHAVDQDVETAECRHRGDDGIVVGRAGAGVTTRDRHAGVLGAQCRSRSRTATWAPSPRKASTTARPIPEPAPTMSARRWDSQPLTATPAPSHRADR